MALVRDNQLVTDAYRDVSADDALPAAGALLVSLEQWQGHRDRLSRHPDPVGLRLRGDQQPDEIADDLNRFAVIALEFTTFRDGRAYSLARLLRERHGFTGELRAVGDVLLDQLHFMQRVGFDAFEIEGADPLGAYRQAAGEFSVWYQPAADQRPWASRLRHSRRA